LLLLGREDVNDLPVLASPERPTLVGIITRHAIFEIYNREVLHQEDAGIKLVHGESRLNDVVDLPETYRVQLLTPPSSYLGHSLKDLSLRQRFQVSVLAVKKRGWRGESKSELPDPDRPLQAHDRIIVVGHVDDLERLLAEVARDDFTT